MTRRGFSITEVLILVVVLASISIVFAPLFSTLFNHIPRSYRVAQENTQLLDMLGWMRRDIEAGEQLPESFGGHKANDKSLLIESAKGVICYQLQDGKVLRLRLTDNEQRDGGNPEVWSVPNAAIEWAVWKKANKGYAVEVRTYINYAVGRHVEKKMDNSHVYFAGIFREVSNQT
ncbi:MAG TPA: hypothetical protein VMX13_13900 [Sedimentisphaerales bacterium]|nr:hypothetical protein [Sedimentisphaerales bacterium]